jgi:hypothetical protein
MRQPVFYRMKEGGGSWSPSSPAHAFANHDQVTPACHHCGYFLEDHPFWEDQLADVLADLLAMATPS